MVCYYNPSALWEILYGCLSSLTGLFHCAFVIVINTEVLPEIWLSSQTAQQHEHGLIFSPNKQSRSYAVVVQETGLSKPAPPQLKEMLTLVIQGL